jgi:hypothetical protein
MEILTLILLLAVSAVIGRRTTELNLRSAFILILISIAQVIFVIVSLLTMERPPSY